MPVINDPDHQRVLDTDSGIYMNWGDSHWQSFERSCVVWSADHVPLIGATVKEQAIDETGNGQGATLQRYTLLKSWVPPSTLSAMAGLRNDKDLIGELKRLLQVYRYYPAAAPSTLQFEFEDRRRQDGAEALSPDR